MLERSPSLIVSVILITSQHSIDFKQKVDELVNFRELLYLYDDTTADGCLTIYTSP